METLRKGWGVLSRRVGGCSFFTGGRSGAFLF